MKVLQVLPELNSGGVERGTVEFAQFLVAEGHQSLVLSNGGRLVSRLEEEGSTHFTLPVHKKSFLSLRYVSEIVRLLKEEKPDILHLRSRAPAWLCYLAWKKLPPTQRPLLVTTVHGFYSVNPYSAIMTKGERVICVSESVRKYVLQNYPKTKPSKLTVIHRGIDPSRYHPAYRPSPDWLQKWQQENPQLACRKLITLPGRVTRWKGHDDFLEIISELRKTHPEIHGIVAGGAHPRKQGYFHELQEKAKTLNLTDHLTFLGHRSDLQEVLAVSDLVVSLSKDPEAFGRVSLEALALGKPVVAYHHGGVAEQLDELFPAGAIPASDVSAATEKIRSFLDTTPESLPTGCGPFDLQAMNRSILAIYTSEL